MLFSGMSTIVVMPPAAAARVAVSKPSHSVRPGSFTWTCVSTMPGEMTRSPKSRRSIVLAGRSRGPAMRTIVPSSMWRQAALTSLGNTTRLLRNTKDTKAVLEGLSRVSQLLAQKTSWFAKRYKHPLCVLCILGVLMTGGSASGTRRYPAVRRTARSRSPAGRATAPCRPHR
jgi:hypothetical protein